jgi:hypothetical protein
MCRDELVTGQAAAGLVTLATGAEDAAALLACFQGAAPAAGLDRSGGGAGIGEGRMLAIWPPCSAAEALRQARRLRAGHLSGPAATPSSSPPRPLSPAQRGRAPAGGLLPAAGGDGTEEAGLTAWAWQSPWLWPGGPSGSVPRVHAGRCKVMLLFVREPFTPIPSLAWMTHDPWLWPLARSCPVHSTALPNPVPERPPSRASLTYRIQGHLEPRPPRTRWRRGAGSASTSAHGNQTGRPKGSTKEGTGYGRAAGAY